MEKETVVRNWQSPIPHIAVHMINTDSQFQNLRKRPAVVLAEQRCHIHIDFQIGWTLLKMSWHLYLSKYHYNNSNHSVIIHIWRVFVKTIIIGAFFQVNHWLTICRPFRTSLKYPSLKTYIINSHYIQISIKMTRSQIELFLDGQFWHDKPQHLDLGIMEITLPSRDTKV